MWPWRRRSAPVQRTPQETAAPAAAGPRPEPPAWPRLPPIQRTLGTDALTIRPDRVTDTLAAWQNPSYLQPLGHTVGAGEPAGLLRGFAVPVSAEPSLAVQRSTEESPLAVGPVRPQPPAVSRLTTAPQQGLAVALPSVAYAAPAPVAEPDFASGDGGAGAEPVAGSEPALRDAAENLPAADGAATTSIAPPIGETPLITMPEPPAVQRSAAPGPDPGSAPLPRRLGLGEPIVAPSWPPGLPSTGGPAAPTPVVSRQAEPDGGVPPTVPSPPGPSYPEPAPAPGLARPLPELPVVGNTAGRTAGSTAETAPPVTVARLIGDRPAQLLSPDQDGPSSFTPAPLPPRVQRIQWDRGPTADPGPATGGSGHAATWTGSTTAWTGSATDWTGQQPTSGNGHHPAGSGDSTGSARTAVATVQRLREAAAPGSWPTTATPVADAVGTGSGPLLFGPPRGAAPAGAALSSGAFVQRTPESMPPAATPGTPSPLTAAAATPPARPLTLARAVGAPAVAASPGVPDRFFTLQRADGDGQGPAAVPEPASPPPPSGPSPTDGGPGVPGGTGGTGAGAGSAGAAGATAAASKAMEPEELLKKLFDPLLRRLKTELRLDRERHGLRNGPG